ncbi:MAG: VWA domain-containing protein [Armatimonadetes bacterium]|nr:VWA domain-containing protein [Armatimonadota bacterium]
MRRNILLLTWIVTMVGTYCIVKEAQAAENRKRMLQAGIRSGVRHAPKPQPIPAAREGAAPLIQVALLLDTSNSMDGLIDQARTQLWDIVNEFATAKQGGKTADLRVALYEYGNTGIPAGEGHIRQVLPFTTDLDRVSEELFALRTNGGDEYCGQVIQAAVSGLAWSRSRKALKALYIAGNEPFTQGSVDYREACRDAVARGISVNTIHCGSYDGGVSGMWQHGARIGDGAYASIDQNRAVAAIEAPQDRRLAELNARLNATYVAYGAAGREAEARQVAQDAQAAARGPAMAPARTAAKASSQYRNDKWDLVDVLRLRGRKEVYYNVSDKLERGLPPAMEPMDPDERVAYVEGKAKEREEIQAEIKKLGGERTRYVADEMKRRSLSNADTLQGALTQSLREQAAAKGFALGR